MTQQLAQQPSLQTVKGKTQFQQFIAEAVGSRTSQQTVQEED